MTTHNTNAIDPMVVLDGTTFSRPMLIRAMMIIQHDDGGRVDTNGPIAFDADDPKVAV